MADSHEDLDPQRPSPAFTQAPSEGPGPWVRFFAIVVMCGIWGSTWLVIREGLKDLPPLFAASARFSCAAVGMGVMAAVLLRGRETVRPPWDVIAVMGVLNIGLSFGIVYIVETQLPSGLVAVLWSVFTLFVAGLSHFFLPGERLGVYQGLGILLGFTGVVTLFQTDVRSIGGDALPLALLLLISPLVSAVGQIYIKRRASHASSLILNRDAMVLGSLVLWGWMLMTERGAPRAWTPRAIFSLSYLVLAGTMTTYGLYFWLLRYMKATRLGLMAFVIPLIALLLGSALGNEPIGRETLVGSGFVVLGVVFALRQGKGTRRKRRTSAETLETANSE